MTNFSDSLRMCYMDSVLQVMERSRKQALHVTENIIFR